MSKATLDRASRDTTPLRIAVLVSGSGSNLQVLIDAQQSGELPIEIVGVISNREDAYAVTRAIQANINVAVLSHTDSGKRMTIKTFERHASAVLATWEPDLIILAGFMRVLSAHFIHSAPTPMINLHPSLLPAYKGLDTHKRVISAGDDYHGCSIHLVAAELDAGDVLTQAVLEVDPNDDVDSLQKRVQKLEHQLLPWTIKLLATRMLVLNDTESVSTKNYLPHLPWKLFLRDLT